MNNDFPAIELRPAGEWRRVVLYVDIGFLVLVALGVWYYIEGWAEKDKLLTGIPVFAIPTLAINLLVLTSKIRVEKDGIYRRRWLVWDFWRWELFASGTLRRKGNGFIDPARRIGFRSLNPDFIVERERALLIDQIERLIPPPVVESKERYEFQLPLLRKLLITSEGIRLQRWGRPLFSCPWSDVREVEIRRASHGRRDFRRLRLSIENWPEPLDISNRDACLGFLVPEGILHLVSRHIPEENWLIVADRDHRTVAEVDRLIEDCGRGIAGFTHINLACLGLLILAASAMILLDEKPFELVRAFRDFMFVGFIVTPYWFIFRFMRKEMLQRKEVLEATRQTLLAAPPAP